MIKVIFLDRDGVINVDTGYTHKIENFKLEKNAVEGLKFLQDQGYEFIITTNQSGIARGYYTEEDFWKFNDYVVSKLKGQGIRILKTYFSRIIQKKALVNTKKRRPAENPERACSKKPLKISKLTNKILG